jgi:hypothetical protein
VGKEERVGVGEGEGGCCMGGLDRLGPLSKTKLLIAAREMPPQPEAARRRQLCTDAYALARQCLSVLLDCTITRLMYLWLIRHQTVDTCVCGLFGSSCFLCRWQN